MNSKILAVFLAVLFGVVMSAPAEDALMGEFCIYQRHFPKEFLTYILHFPPDIKPCSVAAFGAYKTIEEANKYCSNYCLDKYNVSGRCSSVAIVGEICVCYFK